MVLTLYIDELSQPSRSVVALAYLANIDCKIEKVEVAQGQQFSKEFAKINPNKKLPAMVDGDVVLFESGAILRYMCNTYLPEDNTFYPRNNLNAKYQIEQMMDYHHRFVRPGARAFYSHMLAPLQGTADMFDTEAETRQSEEIAREVDSIIKARGGMVARGIITIADLLVYSEII